MKIRSKLIAPLVAAFFTIGISGTMVLNLWQTTSSKIPVKFASGEHAGEYNPADIRGSYTFGDVSKAFAVPVEALAQAFGVENLENPNAFKCEELEDMYGELEEGEIGTDSVKLFVALYSGLPDSPEETTRLPSPAIGVLKEKLSEAELQEAKSLAVNIAGMKPVSAEQAEDHDSTVDTTVKGNTTFQELLDWGISRQEIEAALGMPIGKPGVSVRGYCEEKGVEFFGIKTALQKMVDAK